MSKKHKNKGTGNKDKDNLSLPLVIRQHPAAKKPWLTAVIVVFLAFMFYTLFTAKDLGIVVPALLTAMVIYSLVPYFFVTTITFTQEEVSVKRFGSPAIFKWDNYRSYSLQGNGVVLWEEMRPASGGASFSQYMKSMRHSVFLPLDAENIEKIEPILSHKLVKLSS